MAAIEMPTKKTSELILEWYERNNQDQHRPHLGASIIGHKCQRYPWMAFHWISVKKFEGRMLRLFEYGHEAEVRMARNLRAIGVDLSTEDAAGKQHTVGAFGGHFGGSMDGFGHGFAEGPSKAAVWENKTMSDSAFNTLLKDGLKKAKPQHYAQVMIYMGLEKMTRAMYTVENKNTDAIHSVWVHFDKEMFDVLMTRAFNTIKSFVPPEKISNDSSFWVCTQCDFHKHCHKGKVPEVNCRTCAMAKPINYTEDVQVTDAKGGGEWQCMRWNAKIPLDAQRVGCDAHRMIPIFLEKANAFKDIMANTGNFRYVNKETNIEWEQGEGSFALTSKELSAMDYSVLAADVCQAKRDLSAQGINTVKAVGGGIDEERGGV